VPIKVWVVLKLSQQIRAEPSCQKLVDAFEF